MSGGSSVERAVCRLNRIVLRQREERRIPLFRGALEQREIHGILFVVRAEDTAAGQRAHERRREADVILVVMAEYEIVDALHAAALEQRRRMESKSSSSAASFTYRLTPSMHTMMQSDLPVSRMSRENVPPPSVSGAAAPHAQSESSAQRAKGAARHRFMGYLSPSSAGITVYFFLPPEV